MYLDRLLELSKNQNFTATGNSTNVIDFGGDFDMGQGQPLYCIIIVEAIDAGSGDESYAVALHSDDNSTFITVFELMRRLIPRNTPVGTRIVIPIPYDSERYFRATVTASGTTPNITLSIYLTSEAPADWKAYPDGI
jgi:hypothetical protein